MKNTSCQSNFAMPTSSFVSGPASSFVAAPTPSAAAPASSFVAAPTPFAAVPASAAPPNLRHAEQVLEQAKSGVNYDELVIMIERALAAWAEASKARAERYGSVDSTYSLAKCVTGLGEIQGISVDIYMKALDKFKDPDWREIFITMPNDMKFEWLERL